MSALILLIGGDRHGEYIEVPREKRHEVYVSPVFIGWSTTNRPVYNHITYSPLWIRLGSKAFLVHARAGLGGVEAERLATDTLLHHALTSKGRALIDDQYNKLMGG